MSGSAGQPESTSAPSGANAAATQRLVAELGAGLLPWPGGGPSLTPADVAASQQGRLLWSTTRAVAAKGYARVVVADITALAGVSRKTFYVFYADKEAAYLAAYDAGLEVMLATIGDVLAGATTPEALAEGLITTYLRVLSAEPEWAQAYLVEIYGAGAAARARRAAGSARFRVVVRQIHELLRRDGRGVEPGPSELELEALVGGLSAVITERVSSGRADELLALAPELIAILLGRLAAPAST